MAVGAYVPAAMHICSAMQPSMCTHPRHTRHHLYPPGAHLQVRPHHWAHRGQRLCAWPVPAGSPAAGRPDRSPQDDGLRGVGVCVLLWGKYVQGSREPVHEPAAKAIEPVDDGIYVAEAGTSGQSVCVLQRHQPSSCALSPAAPPSMPAALRRRSGAGLHCARRALHS